MTEAVAIAEVAPTREQLIASISDPDLKARAEAGDLLVEPGKNNKPVLKDPANGHYVKGSGRPLNAPDSAEVGRNTAHKQTASYRAAAEALISIEGDGYGTFAWLLAQALEAAEGSPQMVPCMHTELHENSKDAKHVIAFKKDAGIIFKLVELLTGSAPKTAELNVNERSLNLTRVLSDADFKVFTKDPLEAARIRSVVEDALDDETDVIELETDE